MWVGPTVKTPVECYFLLKSELEASKWFWAEKFDPESDTVLRRNGWRRWGRKFGSRGAHLAHTTIQVRDKRLGPVDRGGEKRSDARYIKGRTKRICRLVGCGVFKWEVRRLEDFGWGPYRWTVTEMRKVEHAAALVTTHLLSLDTLTLPQACSPPLSPCCWAQGTLFSLPLLGLFGFDAHWTTSWFSMIPWCSPSDSSHLWGSLYSPVTAFQKPPDGWSTPHSLASSASHLPYGFPRHCKQTEPSRLCSPC